MTALAIAGPCAQVRHPQNLGFIAVMVGFLLQWPTILTLAMFPLLVVMHVHLACAEETEACRAFGTAYDRYAAVTPAWLPRPFGHERTRLKPVGVAGA